MNAQCGICKDSFINFENLQATTCGHVFHHNCIKAWLEMGSKTCPQCRNPALQKSLVRLYFDVYKPTEDDVEDLATLRGKNDCLKFELVEKDVEIKKLKKDRADAVSASKELKAFVQSLESKIVTLETQLCFYHSQSKVLAATKTKLEQKTQELEMCKRRTERLASIKSLTEDKHYTSDKDIEDIAQELTRKDMITIICMHKRDIKRLVEENNNLSGLVRMGHSEINSLSNQLAQTKASQSVLQSIVDNINENKQTRIPKLPKSSPSRSAEHSRGASFSPLDEGSLFGDITNERQESRLGTKREFSMDMDQDEPQPKIKKNDHPAPALKPSKVATNNKLAECVKVKSCSSLGSSSSNKVSSSQPGVPLKNGHSSIFKSRIDTHHSGTLKKHLSGSQSSSEFYNGLGGSRRLTMFPEPKLGVSKIKTDRKK